MGVRPHQLARDRNLKLIIYLFSSESLGEQEMLWKHEMAGECFHSFFEFTTFCNMQSLRSFLQYAIFMHDFHSGTLPPTFSNYFTAVNK